MNPVLLFIFSLFTRFVFTYFSFSSVTHDEADIFINGYLLAKTGSDLWNHSLFLISGVLSANSSVAIYLNALFFKFLPKTVFFSRLPLLLINSLIPLLIYLIVYKITKKKVLSLIIYLTANFSPWLIYLSGQSAFNAPLAFVFLLGAIYFLISFKKTILKYGFFILFSFLSYNSYLGIASSFIFLLFLAFITDDVYLRKTLNIKRIFQASIISVVIYIVFTGLLLFAPGNELLKSTGSEIWSANLNKIEHTVWYERLTSKGSPFIKKLTINKITVAGDIFIDRYLSVFNIKTLFLKGDSHPIYGTNKYGLFYLWEMIFIIVAIAKFSEFFKKNTCKFTYLIIAYIIFTPIPVIFQPELSIGLRALPLTFPFFFLIGLGIYYFKTKYKIKLLYIFLLYLIFYSHFLYIIQNKVRIVASEQWHLAEKTLIESLEKEKTKYDKVIVITKEPKETLLLYHFYQTTNSEIIKNSLKANFYQLDNIYFTDTCPNQSISLKNLYLIKRDTCKKSTLPTIPYIEAYDKSGPIYYKIESIK